MPTSALLSGFTGNAFFAVTLQPSLRGHTFSGLSEKVCKKRRWMRIGLYRGATEQARRRTLRPAHDKLFAKLDYSAACVETTLPSRIIATQVDGKTRCRGNNWPSTYAPMVHDSCILLQMFVGADAYIGPFGQFRIRRRFSSKRRALRGPMWASAPTDL